MCVASGRLAKNTTGKCKRLTHLILQGRRRISYFHDERFCIDVCKRMNGAIIHDQIAKCTKSNLLCPAAPQGRAHFDFTASRIRVAYTPCIRDCPQARTTGRRCAGDARIKVTGLQILRVPGREAYLHRLLIPRVISGIDPDRGGVRRCLGCSVSRPGIQQRDARRDTPSKQETTKRQRNKPFPTIKGGNADRANFLTGQKEGKNKGDGQRKDQNDQAVRCIQVLKNALHIKDNCIKRMISKNGHKPLKRSNSVRILPQIRAVGRAPFKVGAFTLLRFSDGPGNAC